MKNLTLSIPSRFSIGSLNINFYGLIVAVAYLLALFVCFKTAKKRGFSSENIVTLMFYVVPLFIIFARAYYVIARWETFDNFWDMLKFWDGGVAFFGGLFGGALGALLYCFIHKKNFFALADVLAPALILAQALSRWGNFFNQEAYGFAVTDPALQWFPFAVFIDDCNIPICNCGGEGWHYATFFYESVLDLIGFTLLMVLLFKVRFKNSGMVAGIYLIFYGTVRAIIEPMRTDSLFWGNVRISFVLGILLAVVGLGYVLFCTILHRRKKTPFEKIMDVLKKDF